MAKKRHHARLASIQLHFWTLLYTKLADNRTKYNGIILFSISLMNYVVK